MQLIVSLWRQKIDFFNKLFGLRILLRKYALCSKDRNHFDIKMPISFHSFELKVSYETCDCYTSAQKTRIRCIGC